MAVNNELIKDDLYEAVNGEWLKTAKIPDDKPATGGFNDLVDEIDKQLMYDFDAYATGKEKSDDSRFNEMIKLYRLAKKFDWRKKVGPQPLKRMLASVENLNSYEDYQSQWKNWILAGMPSPISFDIDADMKNATVYALFASSPSLILPDKSYYEAEKKAQHDQLLQLWSSMVEALMDKLGYSKEEAKKIIDDAIKFDALLAPNVKSAEEAADYSKMYNPQTVAELASATDQLDIAAIIKQLVGEEPEKVIVTEPEYFKALNKILQGNFELFKNWALIRVIRENASYLDDEMREINGRYGRALSGSKKPVSQRKFAFYLARDMFSQVAGDYYGKKYFGPQAKADVHHMVEQMIKVYKGRLTNNQWLSKDTRDKAILKLDKLGIQVGYPDKIPALYDQFKVDEEESLIANLNQLTVTANKELFSRWNKPVDRMRWEMSAATVNAYYHPFKNIIVFPAAILQAPFYSLKQSSSQNYGGIGAVIAHEISHAFDNNGSLFDEFGNLNNWWTDEDSAHFKQLAQKMIEEFDGIPFAGQKVNGKLTVSENIADAGGLSCALEAAKTEADFNAQEFFINWATIWRMKATEQYMQLLLSIDVHAPQKLRANIQAENLDDFYTAFDIKPGNEMYRAPEDRVHIW
ncbi:M13 family metallopeptidase [Limosilactobacillus reuteri]|jgi:putative endopeptidase|uniref:Endothelin-converting protein 1 n=2 Tax=Limosilactobacillus reuteri TaxID=1598 RepID=A5VMG2_LIMRD|nr:M13-type metalloendopeptidase [Limosilactobacillus reuteri]ABQ84036.1 Endothelin-converting protein 1 [Limosilactobacillus reuteri subsp. reuteri]AKP02007.1 endothelin-converting protein 1 [Limosilactobacillus reuteri]EEI09112.1 peptidase family M13 [Limosilactobacillus reuteri MM2-3]EGC14651.1 peptidase family M13 [Limosilactobacillus reuteri MM4-1A]KRK52118.1 endothelin-converting protein 1 [Limosilactobacillus reuteri subsp. reuteri]